MKYQFNIHIAKYYNISSIFNIKVLKSITRVLLSPCRQSNIAHNSQGNQWSDEKFKHTFQPESGWDEGNEVIWLSTQATVSVHPPSSVQLLLSLNCKLGAYFHVFYIQASGVKYLASFDLINSQSVTALELILFMFICNFNIFTVIF